MTFVSVTEGQRPQMRFFSVFKRENLYIMLDDDSVRDRK